MTKQILQIDVLSEWVTDDRVAEYLSEHVVTATLEVHWQHHRDGYSTGGAWLGVDLLEHP